MNNETEHKSLDDQLNKLILDMERKYGHRIADITPDIYNQAYFLKSTAQSYANSACKNQSARNEMQNSGRRLVHKVLFLAYLLGWDLEEAGEHLSPAESLMKMIQQFISEYSGNNADKSDYYSRRGCSYEGD